MSFRICLLLLVFLVKAVSCNNIVTFLPNYGDLPFTLKTGYIGVGKSKDVQLFYYLVESERNPKEDPILLWITGGPGCSSLVGFFFENGPLEFNYSSYDGDNFDTLKLVDNPFSWHKNANMIFLDGPVGTGFSYGRTDEASYSGDTQFADDIYEFLQSFLEMEEHSGFVSNEIYIGGDGYSGNPVPIAVAKILQGQENVLNKAVNLKGYVLGNPGTYFNLDFNAQFTYANQFSFIPNNIYQHAFEVCDGEFLTPGNDECQKIVNYMNKLIENINPVHVAEPSCNDETFNVEDTKQYFKDININGIQRKWCRKHRRPLSEIYINTKSVQDALKVAVGGEEETIIPWSYCNNTIIYDKAARNVLPYHDFIANTSDIRGLIYSGDQSMSINFISTTKWINDFNWTVTDQWKVWSLQNDPKEVAGYTTTYKNGDFELTFKTVKGGGHFAAEYEVEACSEMFLEWINFQDNTLSTSSY